MVSSPPLNATATAGAVGSAVLGVAEAAIGLQALVAAVQQLGRLQVGHLAQRIAQRALEVGRHLLGIAVGTAISQALGAGALLVVLAVGRAGLKLRAILFQPHRADLASLLSVSLPAALDSLSIAMGQLVFMSMVNSLGDASRGAHGIALGWEALGFLTGAAFGTAGMTLVGQNLGAGNPAEARRCGWTAFLMGACAMSLMGILFHNIPWKILSLLVAFGIWFVVMSSNSIEITKEVNLDIEVPSGLTIANEVPSQVSFRLAGSKFFLRTLASSLDTIRIDLTKAKAGPAYYRIEKDSLHLPIGVRVLSISPSTINPVLEHLDRRTVPVEVQQKNEVPNGYRLVKLYASPKNVRIKGPRNILETISSIKSDPIDLSDIPSTLKWDLPLRTGHPNVYFDEDSEPKIMAEVEPTGSNFRVAGVPIRVVGTKALALKPDKAALYVNCPPNLIRSLTPEKVRAYVEVPETKGGIYVREVKVDLPPGVKLVRVVPDRVQVQLE